MSHFLVIATNENGIITDEYLSDDLRIALQSPFSFSDVFIYSHGWWNTPNRATQDYNRFTLEFAQTIYNLAGAAPNKGKFPASSLGIGIYWPSMLSADSNSFFNNFQGASFYTMEKRADAVGEHAGYFLLQSLAAAKVLPQRIHLIGHSFGCKVVCNALQKILDDKNTVAKLNGIQTNLVLIQAAMDCDHLERGDAYGDIAKGYSGLRILATTSKKDKALLNWYPAAQAAKLTTLLDEREALGVRGPTEKAAKEFGGVSQLRVDGSFDRNEVVKLKGKRFVLSDITPLHQDDSKSDQFSGHHSNIFLPQLYELMVGFLFGA